MNTPLYDAVDGYVKKHKPRFHMPGHKGSLPFLKGAALYDVTEIPGLDELYRSGAAIADLEARFAHLYKSGASLLCAGGATLCIQTMLALAAKPGGTVILARGCHVSAINAMALLDLTPAWVYPRHDAATGLAAPVGSGDIRAALLKCPQAAAVYITSPDYYGVMCDVAAISRVCRDFDVPLLVDNAHGAHLQFLPEPAHPIGLGADMCADSLHKTLPVLTGGAMLHIKNPRYVKDAKRRMSLFASTSPSYLIMLSADLSLETLETSFPECLKTTANVVDELKSLAVQKGFALPRGRLDPLKLTLGFFAVGQTREDFTAALLRHNLEPEMTDGFFCVFMASPNNSESDFDRLRGLIADTPQKTPLPAPAFTRFKPAAAKNLRDAVFADTDEIAIEDALGETAGSFMTACPPGIPLAVPGELIDENLMAAFKRSGILRVVVVK